jgi:hypothetical protein
MFFPWVGLFEQLRLADVFVHYDDAQLPQGASFITRVQIKTADGVRWLTVPVRREDRPAIKDVQLDDTQRWREKHLATLRRAYARAPFFDEMHALAAQVYAAETSHLSQFNIAAIEAVSAYFGYRPQFVVSSSLGLTSRASRRLVDIGQTLGAQRYITGHGALDYLEHDLFEDAAITVEYMDYRHAPYPQLHGPFTPFVTILDCVANCGAEGADYIRSEPVYWRDFVDDGHT